jgi:hypothetical protein
LNYKRTWLRIGIPAEPECNGQIRLIERGEEGNAGKCERGLLVVRKEGQPSVGVGDNEVISELRLK